jgi:hypothetical protein
MQLNGPNGSGCSDRLNAGPGSFQLQWADDYVHRAGGTVSSFRRWLAVAASQAKSRDSQDQGNDSEHDTPEGNLQLNALLYPVETGSGANGA